MTKRFSALDAMIRDIVSNTRARSAHVELLVAVTQLVNASGADPCVVVGSLIEGIVTTVAERVPPVERADIAISAVCLLRDRLMERSAI